MNRNLCLHLGCLNHTEFLNYKNEFIKYSYARAADVRKVRLYCSISNNQAIICVHVSHK